MLQKIGLVLAFIYVTCLGLLVVFDISLIVYQFILDVIFPPLKVVILVCSYLWLLVLMVYDVVESYMNRRANRSARIQGRSNDRSLVPAQNRFAVHTHQSRVYSPARQGGHGRFRQNRRMGAYDQETNRYYLYQESYSY